MVCSVKDCLMRIFPSTAFDHRSNENILGNHNILPDLQKPVPCNATHSRSRSRNSVSGGKAYILRSVRGFNE
ncbi:hypothetical protein E2C01_101017 [Portunus trituberculatus]|uniref:Uncharacterized protein n=1 Tax=Portunus trituberculatus TaxID=210409 RepID=A0A5B7KET3_PORTR|nr:hypothetical protein [Portunus trituberculatus]